MLSAVDVAGRISICEQFIDNLWQVCDSIVSLRGYIRVLSFLGA